MNELLILIGLHFIADFPLQGSFIADMKGKRLYILFAHAFIYAFAISIGLAYLGAYADWKMAVILITHMAIDKWKSSQDEAHWNLIYIDQALHMIINTVLFLF